MEFRQAVQNRSTRTAAVIRQFLPTPSMGSVTVDGLLGQSQTLDELTQRRDDALADFDAAGNGETHATGKPATAASTRFGMVLR
ncbi:MAG: hypothetical protein V5B31_03005 [Candidatus Accumulibacter propinquus]|jgi:hypothetical protein|uniref:hypothetical protein n=1 Tax=Candidatus Accumulibacter propinquus TaxID=2954380 RepID=UPI002FC32684